MPDIPLAPDAGTLTLSGTSPVLSFGILVVAGSLSLAGVAPAAQINVPRFPAAGTLSLTGQTPIRFQTILPGIGSLSLSGVAPNNLFTFKASPDPGPLTLAGVTPIRSLDFKVFPGAGSMSLTGLSPLLFGTVRTPGTASLGLVGLAPNEDTRLSVIVGSIYDGATGSKMTTGTLYIKPRSFIRLGNDIVAPKTLAYSIPGSGNISLLLAPSNGVTYIVEFDPNPADTTTPFRLKSGYFYDEWVVPDTPHTIDIAIL